MNNDQYLNRVIELEKKIALFRDAVAYAVGNIEGAVNCVNIGLVTESQAIKRIKEDTDKLWARKCELFDAVEVEK